MAKTVGVVLQFDARDATNAFKDLEHGFRRSHRAASEFGNILGGLSSELGGFGRAFGAVGAALVSGSAWGAAAAGIMLIVDHFKEMGKAAEEAAKKATEEMAKLYDELYQLQKGTRDKEVELMIAGAETAKAVKKAEREELVRRAEESSAGASLYGPDIEKLDAEIAQQEVRIRALAQILAENLNKSIGTGLKQTGEELDKLLEKLTAAEEKEQAWIRSNIVQTLPEWKLPEEMTKPVETGEIPGRKPVIETNPMVIAFNEADVAAKKFRTTMEQIRIIGEGIGGIFEAAGAKIGGAFGKALESVGEMLQAAIQLAIAMAATGGPFAWVNLPATFAAIMAVISAVPKFEQGTPYVPFTGLAMVHQGEAIIPAAENAGRLGSTTIINLRGFDAKDIRRSLRGNRGELARAIRELQDDGRRG